MENDIAIGIIFKLMSGVRLTAKQISLEYEVSPRTVYRYIDHISASGIPLVSFLGKNGGIELDKNYVLDKTFLTSQEADFLINLLKNQKKSQKITILTQKLSIFLKNNSIDKKTNST